MSFQPFVVQCLTCGSQLRVTDPSLVGTIATCPKCNSMVQVDRPEQQIAVGSSNIDSQAITEEAISAAEGASLDTAGPGTSGFVGGKPEDDTSAAGSTPMPPDWQSDRTRRTRQIALVIAVSMTGLLVAIAGFSWFVKWWKGRQSTSQTTRLEAPSEEIASSDTSTASPDDDESNPDGSTPDRSTSITPQVDATDPSPTPEPEQAPGEMTADRSNSDDNASASPAPATPTAPLRAQDSSNLSDLIPTSPLDPVPSKAPAPPPAQVPGGQVSEGLPSDDASQAIGMQELPPELAKYTRFLLEEGPTEKPTLEAPPTMDDVTIEAAADELDDPTITVRPKVVNPKTDLAFRMALDTKGYSLPDLVLLISQITGVPIQIDWVSFDLAGIDLDAPVTTPQGWTTARNALDTVSSSLGAEVREEETLVIITLTDEAFDERLASLIDLHDFAEGQDSAKQVLIEFLGSEGEDAGEQIAVGVSREDHQITAIAVESLRRMRGIQPKVDDVRLHRWSWCSNDPSGQWMPLTGGETLPQPVTPITMADFVRRTARANQASTLVNWYDFERRAIPPEHLLLPHIEADAGTTMRRVLEPLGLQARQVDSNHWWLGRESTYDRLPVVIWTPPLGELRGRFVDELTNIMQGATRDAFRITVDPQSDRALLLLPRFIVRQLPKLADGVAGPSPAAQP